MKVFHFLILMFLVSCSFEKDETITENPLKESLSNFDKIFTNSAPIFNGYKLGDSVSEGVFFMDFLSNPDSFIYIIKIAENKINSIELEISIEDENTAHLLINNIVKKYNNYLKLTKTASNFVTWTYTAKGNLPAEIILIYEKELKTISLDIGYKSQR